VDPDVHAVFVSTASLLGLFNKWLVEAGSKEQFVNNLKIKEFRDELRKAIMNGRFKFRMIHPKTDTSWMNRVKILDCKNKKYEEKTIGEIAKVQNKDPFDTLFDIMIEDPKTKYNCTSDPRWTETTLRTFIKHPDAMLGTDLHIYSFKTSSLKDKQEPPPGIWGMFPRYFRRFVREGRVISLEEFARKSSYLAAQRLGLKDRGIISPGAYADILLFDYEKISDRGTQLDPHQAPVGIAYTLVNGAVVYENMAHTGVKSGKVLRHT
jgi:N-acyl-D-aspartate/D-glutamate deacylase